MIDSESYVTQNLKQKMSEPEIANDFELRLYVEEMIAHYAAQFALATKIDKLGAVAGLYTHANEVLREIPPETANQIKCQKGCSYCCHIPVTIGIQEAAYIGHYCKKHNIPINKKYLRKQLRIPENEISKSDTSACVFLHNKTCSIYPARPMNCRKYLVYNNPDLCNTHKHDRSRVDIFFDFKLEALTSAAFIGGAGRLPEMLLPYSK